MRRIDVWAGKPCCGALTLLRKTGRCLWAGQNRQGPPKKILFIKLVEQGSTVLAYRAICRAMEMVGRENLFFWVFEENKEILDLLNVIPPENVLVTRSSGFGIFCFDVMRTLFKIRRMRIDATIDMEFFARAPAILAFLTGAAKRVGLDRFSSEGPYRGDLLTHRIQYNPYLHVAKQYYLMVESLLTPPDEIPMLKCRPPQLDFAPPCFKPSKGEVEHVQGVLNRVAGRSVESPIVILNQNASDMLPLRRWPAERFVELAKEVLTLRPDANIVMTGAPSEQSAVAKTARAIGSAQVVSVAGKTSLRELLVLFSMADILVTNDSGPGHFSSMTDIHTVTLFGPETPALYGPLGKNTHIVWSGLACSPCVNVFNHRFSSCRDNVCMKSISVAQVLEVVRALLLHPSQAEFSRMP
ncbi:MAG: glycosyltransferase family 9 protein [Thermodesulfobacteriota bacterium]|nr:glycosyltransferase family 9 protein [Thermodesulfobacteriota bacterium]